MINNRPWPFYSSLEGCSFAKEICNSQDPKIILPDITVKSVTLLAVDSGSEKIIITVLKI